jgi:hypothetical protein
LLRLQALTNKQQTAHKENTMAKELNPKKEDQKLLQAVRKELYSRLEDEYTSAEVIVALTSLHAHLSTLQYEPEAPPAREVLYCFCGSWAGYSVKDGLKICCNCHRPYQN